MIEVRSECVIECPVDEVFEFMGDLDKLPQWLEGCRRAWAVSGDPRAAGSRVAHEDEFMGRTFETQFDVIEWEPNERMVFEAISGPMRGRSEESFFEEAGGTVVEIHVTGELSGPLKAANWIAQRAAQHQLDRSLDNLKALLESSA